MKNFVKVASLVATLALAACQTNPTTTAYPKEDTVKSRNVASADHQIWLSGDYGATAPSADKLCWQTGYYPDGNPVAGCDPMAAPVVTPVAGDKILNFGADALFDFDKATLRPAGQQALAALATALKSVAFQQAIVIGHTDSFGSDAYNDRLSLRRAESVKSFLVSQGISAANITTSGMGKRQLAVPSQSMGSPKTRAARIAAEQPNRRVEVNLRGVVVPSNQVDRWNRFLNSIPGVTIK